LCLAISSSAGNWAILHSQRGRLCRMLDMDFREFIFHALRCIRARDRAEVARPRP
jgi:hypothetical protein